MKIPKKYGGLACKYAHKIPFIVKINHNELLSYPNKYEQIRRHKKDGLDRLGLS